jgi:hypothetical protein
VLVFCWSEILLRPVVCVLLAVVVFSCKLHKELGLLDISWLFLLNKAGFPFCSSFFVCVMIGRTYSRQRRARDVRRDQERSGRC